MINKVFLIHEVFFKSTFSWATRSWPKPWRDSSKLSVGKEYPLDWYPFLSPGSSYLLTADLIKGTCRYI